MTDITERHDYIMTTFRLPETVEHRDREVFPGGVYSDPYIGEQEIAWTGLDGDWYWRLNDELPTGPYQSEGDAARMCLREIAKYRVRSIAYKGKVIHVQQQKGDPQSFFEELRGWLLEPLEEGSAA